MEEVSKCSCGKELKPFLPVRHLGEKHPNNYTFEPWYEEMDQPPNITFDKIGIWAASSEDARALFYRGRTLHDAVWTMGGTRKNGGHLTVVKGEE